MLKRQLFRFLLVGLLNTLFGYAVFLSLIELGLHYVLAAFLSTVMGILFNFKTIGTLVFVSKQSNLIVRFFVVYVFIYVLNVLALTALNAFGFGVQLGGAMLLLPMALVSFLLNKYYVFNQTKKN